MTCLLTCRTYFYLRPPRLDSRNTGLALLLLWGHLFTDEKVPWKKSAAAGPAENGILVEMWLTRYVEFVRKFRFIILGLWTVFAIAGAFLTPLFLKNTDNAMGVPDDAPSMVRVLSHSVSTCS